MSRSRRFARRYGRITLAALGGSSLMFGTILILLASLTVTNVARATEICEQFPPDNLPGGDWSCDPNCQPSYPECECCWLGGFCVEDYRGGKIVNCRDYGCPATAPTCGFVFGTGGVIISCSCS